MRCRTKILILFLTLILTFSVFALSVFAIEDGQLFTFRDEYTFDDLSDIRLLCNYSSRIRSVNDEFTQSFVDLGFDKDNDFVTCFYYGDNITTSSFIIGLVEDSSVGSSNYTLFVYDDGVCYTSSLADGSRLYAVSGDTVVFEHDLVYEFNSSYLKGYNESFSQLFPVYVEPVTFISAATSGITHVIGWIGTVISSLILENGALRPLLILFAVPVSISAIFFGVRAVKNVIWGS